MDTLGVELVVDDKGANAKITNFTGKLKLTEKELNDLGKNSSFAGRFSEQLDKAEKRHEEFLRRFKQNKGSSAVLGGQANEFADALRNSVGIPLVTGIGTAAGAALGAGIVIGLKQSLDASLESEKGLRLLNATAKETGIVYGSLASQAADFAKETAQSTAQAQQTFAQIVNFANAAGRIDKLEQFRKSFADLAAAKGINASQLGDISRQLNALTDEATDKLLNANPSAFYEKFAASIGKTADQLTDAEKRAAVFDEVLRKGAIFNGEAEKNLNSTAGQLAQVSANIEDLKSKVGDGIAIPLNFILNAVNNIGGEGANQNSSFWIGLANSIFSGNAPGFGSQVASPDQFGAVNIADEQRWKQIQKSFLDNFNKTREEIKSAIAEPNKDLQNFALRYFTPTLSNSPQEAEKQRTAGLAAARSFLEGQKKAFDEIFKTGNLALIRDNIKLFDTQKGLFDKKDQDALAKSLSSGLAQGYKNGLDMAGKEVVPLRAKLKELFNDKNLLAGDKNSLITEFNRAITQSVDQGKAKVKELGQAWTSVFDSLARQSSDNKFFDFMLDQEAAAKKLREQLKGLPPDLQAVALAMNSAADAKKLFDLKLDNALGVFNLREDAAGFRRAGAADQVSALDRRRAAEEASGLFRNPDYTRALRSAYERDAQGGSINERIQRQIDIATALAKTPEERAAVDRRIISLTQSINPLELTDPLRERAALARENEATRLANADRDAKKEAEDKKKLDNKLLEEITKLRQLAEAEGVEAIIRVIDDTGGKIESRLSKRATQKDTEKYYAG